MVIGNILSIHILRKTAAFLNPESKTEMLARSPSFVCRHKLLCSSKYIKCSHWKEHFKSTLQKTGNYIQITQQVYVLFIVLFWNVL